MTYALHNAIRTVKSAHASANQATITACIHNLRHRIELYPQIIYHGYTKRTGWSIPRMILTLHVDCV